MHRCYIDNDHWTPPLITPSEEATHHLLHVLRLREGDHITAFNGAGKQAEAKIVTSEAQTALEIVRILPAVAPSLNLTLIATVIKGTRMDTLIEKATEIGVSTIKPVLTKRSVVKLDDKQARKKIERWQRIAISAAKQCGSDHLPEIAPIQNLIDLELPSPLIVAALCGSPRPLATIASELISAGNESLAVVIGPEGDFTPDELQHLTQAGAIPASLGPLVLRAETAAIYAASVTMSIADAQPYPH